MTPMPVAPRHSRKFEGVAGRAARALTTAVCALALSVGAVAVSPSSARADDTITTQDYFSYYKLDQARAKGYTGKGVTIAMIEGPVDTSAPELAGANITVKTPCEFEARNRSKLHATAIASILVSQNYGLAPDATLIAYARADSREEGTRKCKKLDASDGMAGLIQTAINDGAQIISISTVVTHQNDQDKWAIARAMAQGVIVVAAMGNDAWEENDSTYGRWSGTVGVSAIETDGQLSSYSSWGPGVVAAGVGGPIKARDYDTGGVKDVQGTSFATPVVAGQIALARSRWPQATPNQILQLVTRSGSNNSGWNQYTGFCAIDPGAILNTDPSQFPDENPLIEKQGGSSPTREEVQQYVDGVVDPAEIDNDNSYTYRGLDESKVGNWQNVYPTHLGTSPRYHRK